MALRISEMEKLEPGIYKNQDSLLFVRVTMRMAGKKAPKALQCSLEAGSTIWDARRVRTELRTKLEEEAKGRKSKVDPETTTFRTYSKLWLAREAKSGRGSTADRYATELGYHLLPTLGDYKLADLNFTVFTEWVEHVESKLQVSGEHYAHDSLKSWWRTLNRLMKAATVEAGLPRNPVDGVRGPKNFERRSVRERETLSVGDFWRVLETVNRYHRQRYAEVCLLVCIGLRPSELYALVWGRLNLELGTLAVTQAVDSKKRLELTKTKRSRDPILPSFATEGLKWHKQYLEKLGRNTGPNDLVFPSVVESYRCSSSLQKTWEVAMRETGIGIRLGATVMRRTFISLANAAGVSRAVSLDTVGHADVRTHDGYTRSSVDERRRDMWKFERFLRTARDDDDEDEESSPSVPVSCSR